MCFRAVGFNVPISQWECTAIRAAYCGLPLSLKQVSDALQLEEFGKLTTGRALIRYFSIPCKPTKANGQRKRNLPQHNLEKWNQYKTYCKHDVIAERAICESLSPYPLPLFERRNYVRDQQINDRGILVDINMAKKMIELDQTHTNKLFSRMRDLTSLENPNSPKQLKEWLSSRLDYEVTTLSKDSLPGLKESTDDKDVKEVIDLRLRTSKTSIKKYAAMINSAGSDSRIRGLFQFYGANRTGRWAGRLVQVQNLPRNYIDNIDQVRKEFVEKDYEYLVNKYENFSDIISQLIRTAFIAPGKITVSDFAAIEARVLSWLAGEKWRMDVFATHGKIYEASAARMFKINIEDVTPEQRSVGKNAELALGYQGSIGAMAGLGSSLREDEMRSTVKKWRKTNPRIVQLWHDMEKCAKLAYANKKRVVSNYRGVAFSYDGRILSIHLPSGKKLSYYEPTMGYNKFNSSCIKYKGMIQTIGKWGSIDTYGGKLVENIVQAISRDILAHTMQNFKGIVLHVHDEVAVEGDCLDELIEVMNKPIPWAKDLVLKSAGFVADFYMKD